jgi:hypothetical protein
LEASDHESLHRKDGNEIARRDGHLDFSSLFGVRPDNAALDNPSFETKQKILRLVVERVEFVDDQITIKHVIPISDVRLQRDQHVNETPSSAFTSLSASSTYSMTGRRKLTGLRHFRGVDHHALGQHSRFDFSDCRACNFDSLVDTLLQAQ